MGSLLAGVNHVALVTDDLDRLIDFYVSVFDAEVMCDLDEGAVRHALIDLGSGAALHPFEVDGCEHGAGRAEIFGRGHLDHVALNVADEAAFEKLRDRLVEAGASDGSVTDFGRVRTVWFRDPDGCEGEIAIWFDGEVRRFDERVIEAYGAK